MRLTLLEIGINNDWLNKGKLSISMTNKTSSLGQNKQNLAVVLQRAGNRTGADKLRCCLISLQPPAEVSSYITCIKLYIIDT